MTVSQVLNHVNDNNYDDDITVTDVPKGYFLAVVANSIQEGASTREVIVDIMQLEQGPGGTRNINTGLFIIRPNEREVKVTVTQDGKELAENTQAYS